jgi:D-beta-D-heptose 7-phosphate kinase/D-beta-D-heptose 1-phosphate adenosyltransferase
MDLIAKFCEISVLVVGDIMLDRFWWGDVSRISPEAPVPVVKLNRTSLLPGGAANVAANVASLGAIPYLLGGVGDDSAAVELDRVMSEAGIIPNSLIKIPGRATTVKTRVIAHGQQVARVDQETSDDISEETQAKAFERFEELAKRVDAVAISDYAKGFLTGPFLNKLIATAKELELPVIVDPKGRDYSRYSGATLITPNRHEAALASNIDDIGETVAYESGQILLETLDVDSVLITEGEDGMSLFERHLPVHHLSASAREVYDVTGAGDTVLAVLATALGAKIALRHAAEIANIAAGLVVEKVGTSVVQLEALQAAIPESSLQTA